MASAEDNRVMASSDKPIDIDDDASIDEEQLEEYREMVEQLGNFPVSGSEGDFSRMRTIDGCAHCSFIHS